MLSIILPASNEGQYIGKCLEALFASDPVPGGAEVIVVANGCTDATAEIARRAIPPEGWQLTVLDLAEGGKPNALNAGDRQARGGIRVYLDADVIVSPALMARLADTLARKAPLYATGTARIPPAQSAITRAYARFWRQLPFARSNAPGYGLFAVNPAGRRRWGEFPAIISDDTYVRLQFSPAERI